MATHPSKYPTPDQVPAGRPITRPLARRSLAADPRGYVPPYVPYQAPRLALPPSGPFSAIVTQTATDYTFKRNAEYR